MREFTFLTGSGVNPDSIPKMLKSPYIGVLSTPASITLKYADRFSKIGIDNGCFARPGEFTMDGYVKYLLKMRPVAHKTLFATAPDVVGDPKKTWVRSLPAFEKIRECGFKSALVGQDGIEDLDIDFEPWDCFFIGGSTKWKLSSGCASVCQEAKRRGKWIHMGRVNSFRRLKIAQDFGCDSADGNVLAFDPPRLGKMIRWLEIINTQKFMDLRWTLNNETRITQNRPQ